MQPIPKNLREAILATLCYFDIFDYPLTEDEIWQYLYWPGSKPTKLPEVVQELSRMTQEKKLETKNGFYFLPGRVANVASRAERFTRSIPQWRTARRLFAHVSQVPYLRASALCNQFALHNAKETSDIDVFIIAETGHIWSVRALVTFFAWLRGVWRHGDKIAGRFCLSFYLTRDSLDLRFMQKQPYDIYLIYWIATLAFVQGSGEEFFAASTWVKDYLPNFEPRKEISLHQSNAPVYTAVAHFEEKIWNRFFGKTREKIIRGLQKKRMQRRQKTHGLASSEEISDTILKFHKNDRRDFFKQEFEKRYSEVSR